MAETTNLPAGVTVERDGPVVRIVGQFRGFISAPRDVGLQGRELDELIVRQRDYFRARGEAVAWKVRGHDEPADLSARLRAAGFSPEEQETVLIAPVEALAIEPAAPDSVTIRQVTADEDLRRIAELESEVWGQDLSRLADDLISRIEADPNGIAVFAAEAAGAVVSAAWLMFRSGTEFAGLLGGSTSADWRGRGIYRALVAHRAKLAANRGVRYLQVDASEDSRPILQRLGFLAVTTTTPYVWAPS
ncbi:GNAT family N-acetyltransferase [Planosporangium thailandense]|uniref:GNAT family N-acetyltransferase n=2 Tax=Planosporangium thailandense TaxID=765197 RepID=A0ABX0Y5F6_9ACTN|nr:GNAT family N-acetyltransferase [Planosporangium thailandense]NJC72653.1 GNAT family N-acetyltransferase [Planosporangium thailandense]